MARVEKPSSKRTRPAQNRSIPFGHAKWGGTCVGVRPGYGIGPVWGSGDLCEEGGAAHAMPERGATPALVPPVRSDAPSPDCQAGRGSVSRCSSFGAVTGYVADPVKGA